MRLAINLVTAMFAAGCGGVPDAPAGPAGRVTAAVDDVPATADWNRQAGTIDRAGRLKENIADMGNASDPLMRLRPVTFYYRSDRNPAGRARQYGLIAEEVARVAPDLVARSRDGHAEAVFYEFLTPMLLNELQRVQRTLDAQTTRLARLERKLAALRQETLVPVAPHARPAAESH